jgi:hypothetical protein
VGYATKDFVSGARSDFSGPSFEAGVTWRPRTYAIVDVVARRFFAESYELGSSFVVNTVGAITMTYISPNGVASTLNYTAGHVTQEGLSRTDTYQSVAARVSYPVRRWARVGAELRHESRDSNASLLEYTRNIILLTLEAAL